LPIDSTELSSITDHELLSEHLTSSQTVGVGSGGGVGVVSMGGVVSGVGVGVVSVVTVEIGSCVL